MTALRINESSGSIGSLQVSDGYGGFLSGSLIAGTNVTIANNLQGDFTINASVAGNEVAIGDPEDSTYTDGLFKDFTNNTRLGVAIDRFNEILALLAPAPAPAVSTINNTSTNGSSVFLSFGASNDLASSDNYFAVDNLTQYGSADVNANYGVDISQSDLRLGVYASIQNIEGVVNEEVSADGSNYVENAFGNADAGQLKLEVNGITTIHTVDITNTGLSGDQINSNGSGFLSLSQAESGRLDNGTVFPNFKHRIVNYKVSQADQRLGWNYARVIHEVAGVEYVTNYIEWINDTDSSQLQANNQSMFFIGTGTSYLSGIKYFTGGTFTYEVEIENAYQKVYDNVATTFTSTFTGNHDNTSLAFAPTNKDVIDTSNGEDHTKTIDISKSANINTDYMLGGTVTVGVNASHPFKANIVNDGQASTNNVLIYNVPDTSTNTLETFSAESYRLTSGSYDNQSDISSGTWNSQIHMTGSTLGYDDGLQFYDQKLYSPSSTLNGGDFASLTIGAPTDNPNYSTETGTRTFYRKFENTGSTIYDIRLDIDGSNTSIVDNTQALDSTDIKVFIKVPEKTGWLDLGLPYSYSNNGDNDGCYVLNFDSSLNAINYVTFGTVGILQNEYIILKVVADMSWQGNINQLELTFNAGTGNIPSVSEVTSVGVDQTGAQANLSFGSTRSISNYTNSSIKDLNELYGNTSSGSTKVRGVYKKLTDITGKVNESVSAVTPGYPSYSFLDGDVGNLELYLNGAKIQDVDLTTHISGPVLTSNSGFDSISASLPSLKYSNGVPNYLQFYRTASYIIKPDLQDDGENTLKVIHRIGSEERITNEVKWVNDASSQTNNISFSNSEISDFTSASTFFLSGVKYFINPTGVIKSSVASLYQNVYSNASNAVEIINLTNSTCTGIELGGSGLVSTKTSSGTSTTLQTLNSNSNSNLTELNVTGSLTFNQSTSISGSFESPDPKTITGNVRVVHPLKGTVTSSPIASAPFLVYSVTNTSDASNNENFNSENFRLQTGNFDNQTDITDSSYDWNSEISVNDNTQTGFYGGLILHGNKLVAPVNAGNSGDFRSINDGGIFISPANNANYSTLGNDALTFYRHFYNNTDNDVASLTITLKGDATIVNTVTSLGINKNINVEIKTPGKTGWMDLGNPTDGSSSDGSGCYVGNFTSSITLSGATNTCSFGTTTVDGNSDYFVVKITANKGWTGYLSQITIGWG